MKFSVSIRSRLLVAACCAGCACLGKPSNANAQHAHADILVGNQGGQIVTLTETGPEIFETTQVFEAELPATFFTDDPGFNNDEVDEFPAGIGALNANTAVNLSMVAMTLPGQTASNLLYWDGTGAVPSFGAVTNGTTFTASNPTGALTSDDITVDGGSADTSSIAFTTTDALGGLHKHINFFMLDSNDTVTGIDAGIYVVSMIVAQAGLTSSDPFYLVLATDGIDEEIHEAAVGFVESVLVPEPTTAGLLAIGGLLIARRRRAA